MRTGSPGLASRSRRQRAAPRVSGSQRSTITTSGSAAWTTSRAWASSNARTTSKPSDSSASSRARPVPGWSLTTSSRSAPFRAATTIRQGSPQARGPRLTQLRQSATAALAGPTRKSDRFQARRSPERVQQAANVVPDRLAAQSQLLGDLCGRAAPLEQLQHLRLPRRQLELRVPARLLHHVGHQPEHTDDVLTAPKGHGADFDSEMVALSVDDPQRCIGDLAVADDLAGEDVL